MFSADFWSIAIPLTLASSANIIFQSQSIFAYVFSIFILKDKLFMRRLIPMFICLCGVILTSVASKGASNPPAKSTPFFTCGGFCMVVGNVMMIFVALFYGLYEVLYKKELGSASVSPRLSLLLISLLGLHTLIFSFPLVVLWCVTGTKFHVPLVL